MGKRGQQIMGMPFGVIFSIILIVVFIVIAFIAIGSFLDIGRKSSVGLFYKDLQEAVDNAWESQSAEFDFKINLPSGIKKVCFANLSKTINSNDEVYDEIERYSVYDANVFLYPPQKAEEMQWKKIRHINLSKIIANENPYCVDTSKNLKIKKGFDDRLVVIE
ncbi:hypothetical protein D6829_00395 [Candidatus Pacearchaeota archaeon]|nr:MAG: hypothetical protein D6829_00395 [Candidatus Pacearchaeota archaeon]